MKSIWGLKKSTNNQNNYDEKYYFTSNSGQVVSEDGSGYVIPLISNDSIQNTEYIPLEYAEKKIKSLTNESISSQEGYKHNIDQMNKYYKNSMNEVKDFYDKYIKDLKAKALRHIEIKKQIYDLQEQKLRDELQHSEKSLDELRDDLANLNKDYQEDMRTLKTELSNKCLENDRSLYQISELQKSHSTSEIQRLINEMIHHIELNDIITSNKNSFTQLSVKFHNIENELRNKIYLLQNDLKHKEDTFNIELLIRKECYLALSSILTDIEIKEMLSTNDQLHCLETKVYESEQTNISHHQKLFTELTLAKQVNEQLLVEIESHKAIINEQARMNEVQVNDIIDKHSSDKLESKLGYHNDLKHVQDDIEVKLCLSNIISTMLENNLIKEITENKSIFDIMNKYQEKLNKVETKFIADHTVLVTHLQSIEDKANKCENYLLLLKNEGVRNITQSNIAAKSLISNDSVNNNAADEKIIMNQSNIEAKGLIINNNYINNIADEKTIMGYSNIEAKGLINNNAMNNAAAAATDDKTIMNNSITEAKGFINKVMDSQVDILEEQLKALHVKETEYLKELEVSMLEYGQLDESWNLVSNQKEACKAEIKNWVATFKEINNREPDVNDKASVKDKYQLYKVLTNKTKQIEDRKNEMKLAQDKLNLSLDDVRNNILHLKELIKVQEQRLNTSKSFIVPSSSPVIAASNLSPTAANNVGSVNYIKPHTSDAEIQTDDTLAVKLRKGMSQKLMVDSNEINTNGGDKLQELELQHQADTQTIEQLDDQLFQITKNYEQIQSEKFKLIEELRVLTVQTDELIKAKRTDVVKKYEDDIESLLKTETSLRDKIANLSAEKTKNEAKINELLSRAENAEGELKERDEREKKDLDPKDEKLILKGQISKQRNDIILKGKAATAGWDAAADADERLDLEIERAYKKGLNEERDYHKESMRSLNQAIEEKENRITQLLVTFSEMERKVLHNETEMKRMTVENEELKLEVVDTIASLRTLGGGGGSSNEDGSTDLISNEELEATREELNNTQEELVALIERCDRIEQELEVSRKKNRAYEKLTEIVGLNNTEMMLKRVEDGTKSGYKASNASRTYDLSEVKNIINKSINKGTNLWKSNRKDECYELYLETCEDCSERLLTSDLKNHISDAISNGKNLGLQNKQRGAVVLRKGLDKILSELEKPNVRNAEEAEALKLKEEAATTKTIQNSNTESNVVNLVNELNQIENSFLEQGYTKEKNPSNSSAAGNELTTPRGEKDSAASLLARAKNAEAKIESLKKQLATVLKSTASDITTSQNALPTAANKDLLSTTTVTNGKRNGADPAEVRQLNRKIKELEAKLKASSDLGSNFDEGNVDSKLSKQNDKVLEKKLKESEVLHKKEIKNIEMRAVKAENALKKMESTSGTAIRERDTLKEEVVKLRGEVVEIAQLRNKAEHAIELENSLQLKTSEYDQLSEQFKKETALRKKYKNELEDLKGAIRVYARCRPMAKYELEKGCKSVVQIKDETSLKLSTSRGEKEFEFDAVFGDKSTQEAVFEDTKRLVESCIDGFNVCLFAYGQTGSGKTFTMTGSSSMPGLTPKAIDELYRLISERKHLKVTVTTYFVELYNDNLVDLYWILDSKASKVSSVEPPRLEIKMDEKKMVFVRNSVIKEVFSPSELMDLFNKGNVERHTGATKMNAESSRSHSIFSIMVECYDKATKRTTTGKLSLVDLAGSERADKTGAAAERLKEAQSINKSLSALGDVIAALSEGGAKHIPYRNNKLTQLMQDSLGGNAKTLMFVNFSPADYNSDETATSLMYAARVKKIVNNASKQAESEEVAKLKQIIKRLQSGQKVENDLEDQQQEIEIPTIQDDQIYDGY